MAKRVQLICWKAGDGREAVAALRDAGYDVVAGVFAPGAGKALRASPPEAVVIDLSRMPMQGRDVGIDMQQE